MKSRRRRYVVNAAFQGRFVLGFLLATLGGGIAAAVLFYVLAQSRLEHLQWSVFLKARSIVEVVQPLFVQVSLAAVVFVGILLAVTWVRMMSRVNGPLTGMTRHLRRMAAGDFSAGIALRRNDEFGHTAQALNEMMVKTGDRWRELKTGYEEVSHALRDLETAAAGGVPCGDKAARARALVRKLRRGLAAAGEVSSETR